MSSHMSSRPTFAQVLPEGAPPLDSGLYEQATLGDLRTTTFPGSRGGCWSWLIAGAQYWRFNIAQRVLFEHCNFIYRWHVVSGLTRGAETMSRRRTMWAIAQTTWPSILRIQKEAIMDFRRLRSHACSPPYISHQMKWRAQLFLHSEKVYQCTSVANEL